MLILFETIKIIFFLFTILLATIVMKGELFLGAETFATLHKVLLPAYLIFIGVLMGYVGALLSVTNNQSAETRNLVYTRMFIIGIVLGALFALAYIFFI